MDSGHFGVALVCTITRFVLGRHILSSDQRGDPQEPQLKNHTAQEQLVADVIQSTVLNSLASLTGKQLCWSLILIMLSTSPAVASDCSVFLTQ